MKIGIPKDYFGEGMDEEVKKPILEAAEVLKNAGAEIEEFDLGLVKYAIPAYYVIASAEASSNLSRFDGVKYGTAQRIMKSFTRCTKRPAPRASDRR